MTNFAFTADLPTTIETPRLFLRRPTHAHAQAIARLANNKNIHQYMSRLPFPYALEDAAHFIGKIARSENEHAFAICNRDDDFMGLCSVMNRPNAPELGYWLGEPYWGEGFVTEAVAGLIASLEALGQFNFDARADASNGGSQRVLEKLNFKKIKQVTEDCGQHKNVSLVYYERRRDDDR